MNLKITLLDILTSFLCLVITSWALIDISCMVYKQPQLDKYDALLLAVCITSFLSCVITSMCKYNKYLNQ